MVEVFSSFVAKRIRLFFFFNRASKLDASKKLVWQIPHLREELLVELEHVSFVSGASGGGRGRRGGPDEGNARLFKV